MIKKFALIACILFPMAAIADDVESQRLREAKEYFVKEANRSGAPIFEALKDIREYPGGVPIELTSRDISALETNSEVCAHQADSFEARSFLIGVKYVAFDRYNYDDNGNYRSNTVDNVKKAVPPEA